MTFTSFWYLLFLPAVFIIFFLTKDRYHWIVHVIAGYGFYASLGAPHLLIALALVTVVSYAFGRRLGKQEADLKRTGLLWTGICLCVSVLVLTKYLLPLLGSAGPLPGVLVTVGVSYYSFQAISYLIDVYLRVQDPEQHFGVHAAALAFFPKLPQGPIERAGNILPQLKKPFVFSYQTARSGLLLLVWGLLKKTVVADRLALLVVDPVFSNVSSYSGITLLLATVAYSFQIFFDFSGYTDMARGAARLFGIDLSENFNHPYAATSVADFWRRWHISFSRWILDYIFRPLQMAWRHLGKYATALALVITFLVSGFWHGARPGFIVWGLIYGVSLAASSLFRPVQKRIHGRLGLTTRKLHKAWSVVVTFAIVNVAWVFFRSETIDDAVRVIRGVFSWKDNLSVLRAQGLQQFVTSQLFVGFGSWWDPLVLAVFVPLVLVFDGKICSVTFARTTIPRWLIYFGLFFAVVLCGSPAAPFVYFQF